MSGRVVVVGAGPSGLAAARAAADAGARVVLIDSATQPGGQYHRRPAVDRTAGAHDPTSFIGRVWSSRRGSSGRRRSDAVSVDHPLITYLPETTVWAIEPVGGRQRLRLQTGPADAPGRTMRTLDAGALVLATGAYDRALPFPGWDLPGVYTAGAAQALAKGQGIAVGRRVVVAGTGPFLLPVARSLVDAGARVVALLEANDAGTISRGWLEAPRSAGAKLGEFASYAAALARHRIPFQLGRAVVIAHGKDRVDAVTTARLDREWNPVLGSEDRIEVDAVCAGYGFTAQLELAVSAGCVLVTGPDGGGAVQVDDDQHTGVPGVYAAGELTGIAGAAPAAAEGVVAGAAAAAHLGHGSGPATAQRRKVADGRRLARALAAAYPVRPGWRTWLTDETLICRCEEVSYAQLRDATELGTSGRALKLTSRAGLGLCQGRVCARNTADLAGAAADHTAGSRRPIAVPVRLRDLAATPVADTTMEEI